MKKVLFKGPILSNSSYGIHSRQIVEALMTRKNIDLYIKPTNWGYNEWYLHDLDYVNLIKKFIEKSHVGLYDESYQLSLPEEWEILGIKNIGITAGFEANIVKKEWIKNLNKMNFVITPSEFTKDSFIRTAQKNNLYIKTQIKPIGEWFFNEILYEKDLDSSLDLKFSKNILMIGQISNINPVVDRKNTIKTLHTIFNFIRDKDIGVILKTNLANNSSKLKNLLLDNLKEEFDLNDLKKLGLIVKSLTDKQMVEIYQNKKVSCFVSGTRAEGWGLPFVESAACGLPIIATNYSAYTEFLENDFLKVDYMLEKLTFNDRKFVDSGEEPLWAEFSAHDMIEKLEDFFKNEDKYIEIANKRKKIIKQNFCKDSIIKKYSEFFKRIE